MALIADLVHQTTASSGTGSLTLIAANGKQTFADAFGTGGTDRFYYFVSSQSAVEWEVGTGHMSDATTLVRDTVLASSNGGSAVNFAAGLKDVACDLPAARQVQAPIQLKWLSKCVGEYYVADTGETGVDIPPKDPSAGMGVWVELTADLTGSGQFNEGKLTSQSVTGSAPLVLATAVVNWPASPMHGQTIRLLNTERRFLRAGSAGTIEHDQMQVITGKTHYAWGNVGALEGAFEDDGTSTAVLGTAVGNQSKRLRFNSASSPGARAGDETRAKNIGVRMFRRVG